MVSDKPVGRRAGANRRAHQEAWARKEREQRSLIPLTPGHRNCGKAGRNGREREGCAPVELGATPDCQAIGRAALAKQDRPTPSRRAWARESASESNSARAERTARELAPCAREPSRAGNECLGDRKGPELRGQLPKLVRARHGCERRTGARETAESGNAQALKRDTTTGGAQRQS